MEADVPNEESPVPYIIPEEHKIPLLRKEKAVFVRQGDSARYFLVDSPASFIIPKEKAVAYPTQVRPETNAVPFRSLDCVFVDPNGLPAAVLGKYWDSISLSPNENDALDALRIISHDVERIALKEREEPPIKGPNNSEMSPRIVYAKLASQEDAIPLRALGDGIGRVFGIVLSLIMARGGILLLDEVENGLHYTVQPDVWRMIFRMSSKLNVQVFATTHSSDCVRAFQEAASESAEEGVLIRLVRKGDRILVAEFDEETLEIAVEGNIEVR